MLLSATSYRNNRLFERTEKIDPQSLAATELYIVRFILDNPSMYLHEVCQECFDLTISPSTICNLLKQYRKLGKRFGQWQGNAVMYWEVLLCPKLQTEKCLYGWMRLGRTRETEEVCVSQIFLSSGSSQCRCSYNLFWATHSGVDKSYYKWE